MKVLCTLALFLSLAGAKSPVQSDSSDKKPNACVSLLVHPDSRCKEDPVKTISFPTWTEPGSPCYTSDKMVVSVKDQYCNKETGNWHQTVYPKDGNCEDVPWWLSWIFPQDQVFIPDGCIVGMDESGAAGFSLKSCQEGPCDGDVIDPEEQQSLFASYARLLRA